MHLIVGLGNPGAQYAATRHNAGFEAVSVLAKRNDIVISKRDFQSVIGEGLIAGKRVVLARPLTYMNLSGEAVGAMCRYYKLEASQVIVLVDDIALPVGNIRLRFKGSAGGQNGLNNILKHLGTQEVPRIRIGVGANVKGALVDHVLSKFNKEDAEFIQISYIRVAEAVELALKDSFENAMNVYNVVDKPKDAS